MVIDHINQIRDDNRISNLRKITKAENSRNAKLSKVNTSGVVGVRWYTAKCGNEYAVAYWRDNGKIKSKCFSTLHLKHETAFKMACEHREEMIRQLNEQGAGYTDIHGK